MDNLIRDIIAGIFYLAGGVAAWTLKGFSTSLIEEIFSERNKNRNGLCGFCVFTMIVAFVIYLNNHADR